MKRVIGWNMCAANKTAGICLRVFALAPLMVGRRGGILPPLLVLLTGFATNPSIVLSQDEQEPPVATDKILLDDTATQTEVSQPASSALEVEKKRKALAGLAAIGGIAILGVGVIAATMMWAKRLRRLARDSGPSQKTVGNDFWFLKPPKPVANEPEIPNNHRPPLGEKRDEQ